MALQDLLNPVTNPKAADSISLNTTPYLGGGPRLLSPGLTSSIYPRHEATAAILDDLMAANPIKPSMYLAGGPSAFSAPGSSLASRSAAIQRSLNPLAATPPSAVVTPTVTPPATQAALANVANTAAIAPTVTSALTTAGAGANANASNVAAGFGGTVPPGTIPPAATTTAATAATPTTALGRLRALAASNGGKLTLGRLGSAAITGMTLKSLTAPLGNGNDWGDYASSAIAGAGAGAIIGAPFGGIGAVPGAAVGAGVGILGSLGATLLGKTFGEGGEKASKVDIDSVLSAATNYGIEDSDISHLRQYYNLRVELGGGSKEAKQNALDEIGQMVMEEAAAKDAEQQAIEQQRIQFRQQVANQAITARFLEPYFQAAQAQSSARDQLLSQLDSQLPASIRPMMQAATLQNINAQENLANAYMQTALGAPVATAYDQQIRDLAGIAGQVQQQGIQYALNPPSTGDFSTMLQQAQAQEAQA